MHDEYHDTLVRYYHYQDFLLLCWHYQNEGKWSEIIAYGESSLEFIKGLDSSKFSKKDYEYRVNISCEIISCHFYLGDHDKALKVAKDATAYTKQISNNDLKVRISYLISACYRALASKEKGEQHEKYKKDADDYIKEACALCNKYPISQGIKIKVYFNAGALEQDLNNSPSAARKYYEQALNILENPEFKDKFFDNYCRTQIRYIRALLEDTSSDISQSTILDKVNVLNQEITHKKTSTGVRFQETRTGVQFLLLRSKISKKYALLEETQRYANQGLNIARAKSMSTEIKMFEAILIESTRSQSGSPSSNLNEIDKMSINTKKHI